MKRLYIFIITIFLTTVAFSQGNLQFNQVLLLSTNQNSSVLLGTVPAGKTWKIEGYGTNLTSYYNCDFSFNGVDDAFRAGAINIYQNSYAYVSSTQQFWLPAGTPLHAMACNGAVGYRWVSIIEFNIIP
jgi:hypothetical protein